MCETMPHTGLTGRLGSQGLLTVTQPSDPGTLPDFTKYRKHCSWAIPPRTTPRPQQRVFPRICPLSPLQSHLPLCTGRGQQSLPLWIKGHRPSPGLQSNNGMTQ